MRFQAADNLKHHWESKHEKRKCFNCGHCTFKATTQYKITIHSKAIHEGQVQVKINYKYLLSFNAWTFQNSYKGRKHLCTECQQRFRVPSLLQSHVKKCHPDVAAAQNKEYLDAHPLLCTMDTCGKRFSAETELKNHKDRIHRMTGRLTCHYKPTKTIFNMGVLGVKEEANSLLNTGKRDLLRSKVPRLTGLSQAMSKLAQACKLRSKIFGETARETPGHP